MRHSADADDASPYGNGPDKSTEVLFHNTGADFGDCLGAMQDKASKFVGGSGVHKRSRGYFGGSSFSRLDNSEAIEGKSDWAVETSCSMMSDL